MTAAGGKGTLKSNGLGLLAAFAVLSFLFLVVMPRESFWAPRSITALVGGLVVAVVAALLVRKMGAKGGAVLVLAVAIGAGAGYLLWRADAGTVAVQAGLMDCPTATRTSAWVTSPSGDHRCVQVPRCPRGTAPGWHAGGDEPTGTCVRKAAR